MTSRPPRSRRIRTPDRETSATAGDAAVAGLHYVVRGDLPCLADAEVYALHPHAVDTASVRLLAAADLAGQLAAR